MAPGIFETVRSHFFGGQKFNLGLSFGPSYTFYYGAAAALIAFILLNIKRVVD